VQNQYSVFANLRLRLKFCCATNKKHVICCKLGIERKFVLGRQPAIMIYYFMNIGTLVADVKEEKST
jgi:hypothetical protein